MHPGKVGLSFLRVASNAFVMTMFFGMTILLAEILEKFGVAKFEAVALMVIALQLVSEWLKGCYAVYYGQLKPVQLKFKFEEVTNARNG